VVLSDADEAGRMLEDVVLEVLVVEARFGE